MRENITMHFVQAKGILSQNNGMNIYRGCSHGCIYCDSRSRCYGFTHAFEDIEVKKNAPELLEQALRSKPVSYTHLDVYKRQVFHRAGEVFLHRIQAETIHAHIQPEVRHLLKFPAHLFILQIQIRHAVPKSCFIIPVCPIYLRISALGFP